MKLILTQEVFNLGAPGDIVEVKDGYGRNYLLPRGLPSGGPAVPRSRSTRSRRRVRSARSATLEHANEVKSQLEALTVLLQAQAGSSGRLFGAVTPTDIVDAVKAAGGPDIDKRRIQVGNPIKTLGSHQVTVKVHDDVSATVNLNVVPAASA